MSEMWGKFAVVSLGFPIWLGFWPDRPQEPWQLCQELLLLWSLLLIAAIDWHTMWIDCRIVILTLSLAFYDFVIE